MENKEGLLYKKILDLSGVAGYKAFLDKYPNRDIKERTEVDLLYQVFEVLDEAKQEFPCFPICKKYTSDMKNVSATDSKIRCDLGCFAWKDWFLKWFSDAK